MKQTDEDRLHELESKLKYAGFDWYAFDIFLAGEEYAAYAPIGSFKDADVEGWIRRGEGSAGLIVNRLCKSVWGIED